MTPVVMIWWLLNEKILLKGYLGLCWEENDEDGYLSVKLCPLFLYVVIGFFFFWMGLITFQFKVKKFKSFLINEEFELEEIGRCPELEA